MSLSPKRLALLAALPLLLGFSAYAQSSSLTLASGSAAEGASVSLNLSLNAASGSMPSALQWTFSYSASDVTVSVAPGAALNNAGKTVSCNTTGGSTMCLATGLNSNTIASGVVAIVTAKLATYTSSASVPIGVGSTMGVLPNGSGSTLTGTGGTISVQSWVPVPVPVKSLTCSPLTIMTPGASTCTVTLTGAAPSGGASVKLSSSSGSVSVPSSVTVPSGSSSANFTASAASVSSTQTVVLTATLSTSATVSLTLQSTTTVSGLVAAYGFTEGSGSTVTDVSGNGNTGQLQGATWTTSGKYGSALVFNGNALVSINDSASLHLSTGMTLEAWVNPSTVSNAWRDVLYKGNDAYFLEGTSMTNSEPGGGTTLGSGESVVYGTSALAANTWAHLALTYDGSTVRLYVNGVQVSSRSASGAIMTSTNPLQIGGDSLWGQHFNGTIDEVRVYNVSLTAAQIQSDMNTPVGSSGVGNPPTVSSLQCSPNSITSGSSSTCTVSLSQNAPSGGSTVAVSSNNGALSVPSSVSVASGSSSANFNAAAGSVSANQTVTVTASLNSKSATATVTVTPPTVTVTISSLACNPTNLPSGSNSTCTVALSQSAPSGGASVQLSDNSGALTVPASLSIPSGSASGSFTASAGNVSSTSTAAVTATFNSKSITVSLTIQPPAGNPGLMASYSFSEGSGSTVADSSGNGNAGQLSGATWTTSGKYGSALVFNGTSAVVNIKDSTSLHLTTGMTLEAWVNPSTVSSAWRDVIYKGNDNYYLEGTSDRNQYPGAGGTFGGTDLPLIGTKALAANTWTHLAATYDGSTLRLYVNGAQVSSLSQKGNIVTSSNQLQIGGDSFYGQHFQGTIDEIRIYNLALSAAQIQSDMNTPVGTSGGAITRSIPVIPASAGEATATLQAADRAMTDLSSTAQISLSGLSCNPRTAAAGSQVTCELRTSSSSTPLAVQLAASSLQVRVPATVVTRPNQSSLTFLAAVDPLAGHQSVVLSATSGSAVVRETVLVTPSSAPVLQVPARQLAKWGTPVHFDVAAIDPAGLPVQLKANGLPSGAAFDPSRGRFDWTPNATQAGSYRVTFTATNSARQSSSAEVPLEVDSGKPVLTPSGQLACSPGSIASLSGKWLAELGSVLSDPSGNTTNLGGTRVSVNGAYAPLLYASSEQVKFLCPAQNSGAQLSVAVENHSAASNVLQVPMREASPILLSPEGLDSNQGAISFADSTDLVMQRSFLAAAHPAQPGDSLLIWASGLSPEVQPGSVLIKFGDAYATADSIRSVAGYAGVYRIQVRVPAVVSFGDRVPVQIQLALPEGQFTSNLVTAAIEPVRE